MIRKPNITGKSIRAAVILPLILLFASCQSQQTTGVQGELSSKLQMLVTEAVFEVLVKKPEEKNLIYDKELDWTVIPYAIRSDKYYSIGTAFAISSTEAVTAFHVIGLANESDVFAEYYIRDSKSNVYEIDQVHKASNEKDFLVFTVKGRTFSSWFDSEPNYKTNSQVYSIGNALGEGIVVRNGLLLGTVPEEEEGRWNQFKSSADGNPGNSGGPLVTPGGKVVGVVVALRDNILYSLPVSELLSVPSNTTHFRHRYSYGHLLLSNRISKVFETDAALPVGYKELRQFIYKAYKSYYPDAMAELFGEAPKYLDGPNNRYLLYQSVRLDFPEFAFVDKNDDQWKISDLRVQTFDLPGDGTLIQAEVSDYWMLKIRRPKLMPLEKINTDPRTIMDTYLSGTSLERTLGSSGKYRILSLGDPVQTSEYRDSQGRIWLKSWWLLDFIDSIILAYILPMPNGPVVFLTRQSSGQRHIYEWDMEAACDRIYIGYRGNMEEWGEFLSIKKWVPGSLGSFSFAWDEEKKTLDLALPQLSLKVGEPVLNWTSQSTLVMAPSYYLKNGIIEYGFRSLILERDIRGKDYFIIQQHIKPDEKLGVKTLEQWNDVKAAKYPFDGQSRLSEKDNTGSVGGLLVQPGALKDVQYSLYFDMENPGNMDTLSARYKTLEAGILILK
jgi:hypothetical protein